MYSVLRRVLSQLCLTLRPCGPQPTGSVLEDSPGVNTGAGCHALPQGILLAQGLNLRSYISYTGKQVLYHQPHKGGRTESYSGQKCYSRITVTPPESIKDKFEEVTLSSEKRISLQVSQHCNIYTPVSSSLYPSADHSGSTGQTCTSDMDEQMNGWISLRMKFYHNKISYMLK